MKIALLLSILCVMATLTETLGTAKQPRPSYNYTPPRIQSPYPQYPSFRAQTPEQTSPIPSAVFAQNQQQAQAPRPPMGFQAEYNYDPILARISALGDMTIANARSEAANLKKRAFIEAGDSDITRALGADQNTIDAAGANPFSTQKLLNKDYLERGRDLDQYENQNNLYYSGKRADDLTELANQHTKAYTDWSQVLRDLLSNIDTGLLTAEEADQRRRLAAAGDTPPGGTAPGGTGTGTGAPPPSGAGGTGPGQGPVEGPFPSRAGDYPPGIPDLNVVGTPPNLNAPVTLADWRLRQGREQRLLESLGLG